MTDDDMRAAMCAWLHTAATNYCTVCSKTDAYRSVGGYGGAMISDDSAVVRVIQRLAVTVWMMIGSGVLMLLVATVTGRVNVVIDGVPHSIHIGIAEAR